MLLRISFSRIWRPYPHSHVMASNVVLLHSTNHKKQYKIKCDLVSHTILDWKISDMLPKQEFPYFRMNRFSSSFSFSPFSFHFKFSFSSTNEWDLFPGNFLPPRILKLSSFRDYFCYSFMIYIVCICKLLWSFIMCFDLRIESLVWDYIIRRWAHQL